MTPDVARWLVSDEGREAVAVATALLASGEGNLVVAERLRASGVEHERRAAAIDVALASVDHGTDALVTFDALAQSSPPEAARWRARRFAGSPHILDLCTGAGNDAAALAGIAPTVSIEIDEATAILARHNLAGTDARVIVGDALAPPAQAETLHADPARRGGGARRRGLRETSPPAAELLAHARAARGACVLVAPGVDLADPALPADAELEFIQRGRDLVECAVWLGELRTPGAHASATTLPAGETLVRTHDPIRAVPCADPRYIVEPSPALVRARLHEELAAGFGGGPLVRGRAVLGAPALPPPSPWYRVWRTVGQGPMRADELRRAVLASGAPLEVSLHGARLDIEEIWRRLGDVRRGPDGVRAFIVGGPTTSWFLADPVR